MAKKYVDKDKLLAIKLTKIVGGCYCDYCIRLRKIIEEINKSSS